MGYCRNCGQPLTEGASFCGSCGAAAAPAPPMTAPTMSPPGASVAPSPNGPVVSSSTGPGMPRAAKIVLLAGSVFGALAIAGTVAWQVLVPDPGAGSPEEAVTELLESLADGDVTGAALMIHPAEIQDLAEAYDTVNERAGAGGEGTDLTSTLDSFEIDLTDLEVDVDMIGSDENAAHVEIKDGSLSIEATDDLAPRLQGIVPAGWSDDIDLRDVADEFDDEFGSHGSMYLTTVKYDGRWYVTVVGTVADHMLEDEGFQYEVGNYSADYQALSDDLPERAASEDPEDVVEDFVDAVDSNDAEEILAHLPEDQASLLAPYAEALSDMASDWGVSWSVDARGVDVEVETEGDRATLWVDRMRLEVSGSSHSDYGEGALEVDGACIIADGDHACLDDEIDPMEVLGFDRLFVVATEADGGWVIDPAATAARYVGLLAENTPIEDTLAFLDLEWAMAPTFTLESGVEQRVQIDDFGYAMGEIAVEEGAWLVDDLPDECWAEVFEHRQYGRYLPTVAEESGMRKVLIDCDSDLAGEEIDVTLTAAEPQPADAADRFDRGVYAVRLDGQYRVPEGMHVCPDDVSGFEFCAYPGQVAPDDADTIGEGEDAIVVVEEDGLRLEEFRSGFDDGSSYRSGSVANDGVVHHSYYTGQECVTISLTTGWDAVLEVDDEYVDGEFAGTESYYGCPGSGEELDILVSAPFGEGGSYSLSASESSY